MSVFGDFVYTCICHTHKIVTLWYFFYRRAEPGDRSEQWWCHQYTAVLVYSSTGRGTTSSSRGRYVTWQDHMTTWSAWLLYHLQLLTKLCVCVCERERERERERDFVSIYSSTGRMIQSIHPVGTSWWACSEAWEVQRLWECVWPHLFPLDSNGLPHILMTDRQTDKRTGKEFSTKMCDKIFNVSLAVIISSFVFCVSLSNLSFVILKLW